MNRPVSIILAVAVFDVAAIACGVVSSSFAASAGASAPSPFSATVQKQISGMDFTTRCAQPGVIKCVGFDSDSDFNIGSGGTGGAYGLNSGIFPPSGTTDFTRATRDTTVKASGSSSLKFTIPANSRSDSSGAYFTNFSADLSTQFGENSDFFIQWRQRFSPEFVATKFAGGGGWKQLIIGTGDMPRAFATSCTALEVVVQNTYQHGFPQMYNSCTGSTSHGPYDPFAERFGVYDFKLENGMPAPYCLYSQSSTSYYPPVGNCFPYVANEWLTFQVEIKTGRRVKDEFTNSYVTLWVAREGQPSTQAILWGPYNLTAGSPGDNQRFGKVWLLPYNTGKAAAVTNPVAYTWYDELIISRKRIADPP